MTSLRISVAVFSYNFSEYIGECIETLLAQTLRPWEIIVCDDFSTDDSWSIVSRYQRRHPDTIRAFRHRSNIGIAANTNFGLGRAQGDLCAWIDGDDIWLPKKLELEWAVMSANGADIAYSDVLLMDRDGREIGRWDRPYGERMPEGDIFVPVYSKRFFAGENRSVFRHQLMRRSCLAGGGKADENLESYMDWDVKIRLADKFRFAHTGEPLVMYRRHAAGFSATEAARHHRGLKSVYEKNTHLLGRRPLLDEARIRWSIEPLIAKNRKSLATLEEQEHYSPENVVLRHSELLSRLSSKEKAYL